MDYNEEVIIPLKGTTMSEKNKNLIVRAFNRYVEFADGPDESLITMIKNRKKK